MGTAINGHVNLGAAHRVGGQGSFDSAGADGMHQIGAGDARELQVQENCEGDMPLPHVQKASVE